MILKKKVEEGKSAINGVKGISVSVKAIKQARFNKVKDRLKERMGYNWQARSMVVTSVLAWIFVIVTSIIFRFKLVKACTELGIFTDANIGIGLRSNSL